MSHVADPPRERDGTFARYRREPEGSLLGDSSPQPGDRVKVRGVRGCRVVSLEGNIVTVRPPEGGKMVAKLDELTADVEQAEDRESNLVIEAQVAKMLTSVRQMTAQTKHELNHPTTSIEREALDSLALMYADGTMGVERYVYVMRATQDAPLGANHAALAIAMRHRLQEKHYQALTQAVRDAGGVLPD